MSWKNVQYQNGKFKTTNGGGGGASTFAGLDDVNFSNVQNGQVPKYNSTTQKWENANESGGGGTVTDVTVDGTSVVNQQGVAEITMPTPPTIPVQDVEVDGVSVVNAQGVAEITTPTPDYPVTDVKVNGTSVVNNKQALIKSYKEVTQAEYNALPASKTSDGVLYCIKDSAGADGFPPLIYSDKEREIGVWRDGKPLYQRTFHVTATGNSDTDLDTNIDHFFLVGNTYYGDTDKLSEQYIGSGVTAYCYVQVLQVNGVWTLRLHNMHNNTLTFWVTVRYTKTTDVAGSGTWTTQGALAHHYSTEEHIIGTWIDGKPIYERVVTKTASGAWPQTFTTLEYFPNLETCIKMEIIIHRSGGSFYTANGSSSAEYTEVPQYTQYKIAAGMRDVGTNPNLQYYVNGYTNTDVDKLYFIVQYTKTTD